MWSRKPVLECFELEISSDVYTHRPHFPRGVAIAVDSNFGFTFVYLLHWTFIFVFFSLIHCSNTVGHVICWRLRKRSERGRSCRKAVIGCEWRCGMEWFNSFHRGGFCVRIRSRDISLEEFYNEFSALALSLCEAQTHRRRGKKEKKVLCFVAMLSPASNGHSFSLNFFPITVLT